MSEEKSTESAEGNEPAGGSPEGSTSAHKEAPKVESAPSGASQDYTKHFEELFRSVAALPESLINALREAVPKKEADPAENQHNVVHQEKDPAATQVTPGKKGEQAASAPLKADKRPFRDMWLGK